MVSDMLLNSDSCNDDSDNSFIEESSTSRPANNSNIECHKDIIDPVFDSD